MAPQATSQDGPLTAQNETPGCAWRESRGHLPSSQKIPADVVTNETLMFSSLKILVQKVGSCVISFEDLQLSCWQSVPWKCQVSAFITSKVKADPSTGKSWSQPQGLSRPWNQNPMLGCVQTRPARLPQRIQRQHPRCGRGRERRPQGGGGDGGEGRRSGDSHEGQEPAPWLCAAKPRGVGPGPKPNSRRAALTRVVHAQQPLPGSTSGGLLAAKAGTSALAAKVSLHRSGMLPPGVGCTASPAQSVSEGQP